LVYWLWALNVRLKKRRFAANSKPKLEIEIINTSKHDLPQYESSLAAGMDLRANLAQTVELKPMERALIGTGLFMALPDDCEAQIRPRSGLALKRGITVLNSPGTIDPDYRGEIKVLLVNLSQESQIIEDGERIAQMVFSRFRQGDWKTVDKLNETKRGAGGYGHTGTK
jgi:dUTP pyrophosphatase